VRPIALLVAAAFLLMPAVAPSQAHHGKKRDHVVANASYAKVKKSKKPKVQKEQYLRAVPSR
jgi:hypothetical protein